MIYFNKLDVEFVKAQLPLMKEIFAKFENSVAGVYLFGSFHSGKTTPLSDVDIAILFKKSVCESKIKKIEGQIYEDISKFLKTDEIDLVNLNKAPLSIQYGILKNKELIYFNNKYEIIDFENNVVLRYLDFKPYRDEFNEAFIKFLKESVKLNG